jgi:hypothetical protein
MRQESRNRFAVIWWLYFRRSRRLERLPIFTFKGGNERTYRGSFEGCYFGINFKVIQEITVRWIVVCSFSRFEQLITIFPGLLSIF